MTVLRLHGIPAPRPWRTLLLPNGRHPVACALLRPCRAWRGAARRGALWLLSVPGERARALAAESSVHTQQCRLVFWVRTCASLSVPFPRRGEKRPEVVAPARRCRASAVGATEAPRERGATSVPSEGGPGVAAVRAGGRGRGHFRACAGSSLCPAPPSPDRLLPLMAPQ